jgi:hypothetical protein
MPNLDQRIQGPDGAWYRPADDVTGVEFEWDLDGMRMTFTVIAFALGDAIDRGLLVPA